MMQHRFRTAALVGEWRLTRQQAYEDALRARQAQRHRHAPDGIRWIVPGEIETGGSAEHGSWTASGY